MKAYELSWERLLVVDALSREQLTGNLRPGRPPEVSVVLVQLGENEKPSNRSIGEASILAKRMALDDAVKVVREGSMQSCDLPCTPYRGSDLNQQYYDGGFLLFDPLQQLYNRKISSVLSECTGSEAVDQVLDLEPTLPPEIALKIRDTLTATPSWRN